MALALGRKAGDSGARRALARPVATNRNDADMTEQSPSRLNPLGFEPRIRVLHLTWLAFFVSFVVWFNHDVGRAVHFLCSRSALRNAGDHSFLAGFRRSGVRRRHSHGRRMVLGQANGPRARREFRRHHVLRASPRRLVGRPLWPSFRDARLHGRNGRRLFGDELHGARHGRPLRGAGDLLLLALRQRRQWRGLRHVAAHQTAADGTDRRSRRRLRATSAACSSSRIIRS